MTAWILMLALSAQDGGVVTPIPGPDLHVVLPAIKLDQQGQPDPQDPDVPVLLQAMLKAISRQDYQTGAASALMLLIWILRKALLDRVVSGHTDVIPWIGLAIATATGALVGLQAGVPIGPSVLSGVLIGLAACGGWSLIGKHVVSVGTKVVTLVKPKS
jgi:hypothetical protein